MQYSKKVMEMFTNPKNVGEIKNADGVGEVGNPSCLLPEEKIHSDSNLIKIAHIQNNQKVLTHTGNYEKVKGVQSREYKGQIVILKNSLGKLSLTPEHLVFAIKIPKKPKYLRTKNKKSLIPAWYHAEQLERKDIIIYPILKEEKDITNIEINTPKLKWDFKSRNLPRTIPISSNFLRLCGYFLAEGNIVDKPSKTFISFTLSIKEKHIAEDIKNIAKGLFGLDVKIEEKLERNTIRAHIYSARLARFFNILFGTGAENKNIPDLMMSLPPHKQKALLVGLWKGDGYVNIRRTGARAVYATISYKLSQQIKILLLRQKIIPSIYVENAKEIRGVKHRKSYRLHVGQRESLLRLCSVLNMSYHPKSHASVGSWFDTDYLYTPITHVEKSEYSGKVYNLEVESAHSFTSEAFCLHNCGDMMTVYIKVGKASSGKDKGKEIIKDIKFKTYGCAAAIATSSMITELAKGKTILEAEQITRKDVADELGGLPPIKMHCSNLAADALRAAIQNYKKKK